LISHVKNLISSFALSVSLVARDIKCFRIGLGLQWVGFKEGTDGDYILYLAYACSGSVIINRACNK